MKDKKFILVCGLHRSGTSLLFQILRDHPEISGFKNTGVNQDEGQHLQSIYLPAKAYGGEGRFGFDPKSYLDEKSSLVSTKNAEKLFSEWSRYWDLNCPFLMEKSPPNLVRTRFLQKMFPNSYFITILRHPVAVAYATMNMVPRRRRYMPRSKMNISSQIEHWLLCHEQFRDDMEHLENLLILKYENFVISPQKVIGQIYNFLDLNSVPISRDVNPNINNKYFTKWKKMRKSFFTHAYSNRIIKTFEQRVSGFGYSLSDLDRISSANFNFTVTKYS